MKVELEYFKGNCATVTKTVELDILPSLQDQAFLRDPDGVLRDGTVVARRWNFNDSEPSVILTIEDESA